MAFQRDLTHAEARAMMDRALSKARELKQVGGFAIVDAGGGVITVSRLGESSTASVRVARPKAHGAAVQLRYQNQHGEGRRLVGQQANERYDDLPHSLDTARRYADRAIEAAQGKGQRISVAVVDEAGQLMQADRMDGVAALAVDLAEA